jgi:hypothetical protein
VFGQLSVYGTAKTPALRSVDDLIGGSVQLQLQSPPVGWAAGDVLLIADTRQVRSGDTQAEQVVIQSISGETVTLVAPLQHDHLGARNATSDRTLRFTPYVHNLTRNVVIRSQAPAGVRGQTLALGRTAWDVNHAVGANQIRRSAQQYLVVG